MWSQNYATEILHTRYVATYAEKHRQQWTMQFHVIVLDTRGTTYTFYEIGKGKEKNKNEEDRSKKKKKTKNKNTGD